MKSELSERCPDNLHTSQQRLSKNCRRTFSNVRFGGIYVILHRSGANKRSDSMKEDEWKLIDF